MRMEDCGGYKRGCIAQLCPLDASNGQKIWYPDEPVCTKHGDKPSWVKTQFKIKKRAANRKTFYTIERLESMKRVSRSVHGLSPDGRHISHSR